MEKEFPNMSFFFSPGRENNHYPEKSKTKNFL